MEDTPNGRLDYATSRLQKGFQLLDRGQNLAEEAVGFGVPVLKRGLQTIFPGNVTLTWVRRDSIWDISAVFELDLVEKISRVGKGNVENELLYAAKNISAAVIRRLPFSRALLTAISSRLRSMFHWETTYAKAGFSTMVKVSCSVEEETGKVNVELVTDDLPPSVTEVIMMNEQGAHYFDRYGDTSGISLQGEEIGCWDEVNAEEAWFESSARRVAFRLARVEGARLYRGRELIGSRLAWAGFGYSFLPSIKRLQYEMRIEKLA
jgi:hypothetical protein